FAERRPVVRRSHLWSSGVLMATVALVGCAGQAPGSGLNLGLPTLLGGSANGAAGNAYGGPSVGKTGGNVALLLPLTGNLAPIGQILENAAKLALPENS